VRNGLKLFWIVAMFATMGFLMMGCDNGNNGGPEIIRHYGVANGVTFVLIITDGTNFELRVGTGANMEISTGTATLGTGGVWTLTPYVDGAPADTFAITAGPGGITDIEGDITFTDGTTQEAPETIAPIPPPGGGNGNNNNNGNNGTGTYPPGTPITITIDGLSAYNGLRGVIALTTMGFDDMDASLDATLAFSPEIVIANGSLIVALYENNDWDMGGTVYNGRGLLRAFTD